MSVDEGRKIKGISPRGISKDDTNSARIPIGRLKSEMQTQIFLQSLKKIEAPNNLRHKESIDWAKIGEVINIKPRLQAMRDLTNVLQRQN